MRILVTGGAGFIGSHLVDRLVALGHNVLVVDDLSSGSRENLPSGVRFERRSVTAELGSLLKEFRPETLFHLAAQIDVRKSVEAPAHDADINIVGALKLFEACRAVGCTRVIFSSTGGALYGDAKLPTPETAPTRPESPYGIAKLAVERYLDFYAAVHGFDACMLRYANVYGPRQAMKGEAGVVAIFARKLLAGETCRIFGDGLQTRDYVYVKDVVDANVAALQHGLRGTYNVGTGVETSVVALHDKLAGILGKDAEPEHAAAIPGELKRSCLAIEKLKPYWRPRYALDEGLRETATWFQQR